MFGLNGQHVLRFGDIEPRLPWPTRLLQAERFAEKAPQQAAHFAAWRNLLSSPMDATAPVPCENLLSLPVYKPPRFLNYLLTPPQEYANGLPSWGYPITDKVPVVQAESR
jgi:hypothetical protein